MDIAKFVYPFTCWWTFGSFPLSVVVNAAAGSMAYKPGVFLKQYPDLFRHPLSSLLSHLSRWKSWLMKRRNIHNMLPTLYYLVKWGTHHHQHKAWCLHGAGDFNPAVWSAWPWWKPGWTKTKYTEDGLRVVSSIHFSAYFVSHSGIKLDCQTKCFGHTALISTPNPVLLGEVL